MIKEYQIEKNKLSTYVPWIAIVDEKAIVLNKNGTFQKTLKFRGHDLESATKYELRNSDSRLNNVLKRLDGAWTIHIESRRVKSKEYRVSEDIKEYAAQVIEDERREAFQKGIYFENEYYLTLTYLVPKDTEKKVLKFFIEETITEAKLDKNLDVFKKEFYEILGLFKELFLEVEELSIEETYTYLHSCVSSKPMDKVTVPAVPNYIANYLCDSDLIGGLKPQLGEKHIRCISLQGFPNYTNTGFLDVLNRLGIEYRAVTRFMFLSKLEAISKMEAKWRATFNGRISLWKRFMMELSGQKEPTKMDEDALQKAEEINTQINLTRGDYLSQGFYSYTLMVYGDTIEEVEEKTSRLEKEINNLGFTTINESINCVEAFLGSVPGNIHNNVRIPILNSITLTHLLPTSCVWGGASHNKHLNAPSLIYTKTSGSTPFRFNIHVGDVGHTSVVGPTGAGKSVFLGLLAAQFKKYKDSQIYFFDKGASSRVLTYAMDGIFYDLGDENLSFQPLKGIGILEENIEKNLKKEIEKEKIRKNIEELSDEEVDKIKNRVRKAEDERANQEKEWANEWLLEIFIQENIILTPTQKTKIWESLELIAQSPLKFRTISSLYTNLNDKVLKEALQKYTVSGALGRYFDSNDENVSLSSWVAFEMEKIMSNKSAVTPLLSYLFRKVENSLKGEPTLIILDECWMFFDNPIFSAKIREWLKVLRKKNASVIFATQELGDILSSNLFSTILDACKTKIYLPNENAEAENYVPIYEKFGLNKKEIAIIGAGTPKKEYYYKSTLGSRIFELALDKKTLKLIASSGVEEQNKAKEIYRELGGGELFVKTYLM